MNKNQHQSEIYTEVSLEVLAKLIGFGPSTQNKAKIPMIVVLETGQILTCQYYNGPSRGANASIFFPDRNYILQNEFEGIEMTQRIKELMDHKTIILDLGEGFMGERSFAWKREEPDFLIKNKINIETAIRLREGKKIPRLKEAYDELLLVEEISQELDLREKLEQQLQGSVEKNIAIHNGVSEIFNETTDLIVHTSPAKRQPMLDEIELRDGIKKKKRI